MAKSLSESWTLHDLQFKSKITILPSTVAWRLGLPGQQQNTAKGNIKIRTGPLFTGRILICSMSNELHNILQASYLNSRCDLTRIMSMNNSKTNSFFEDEEVTLTHFLFR